MNRYRKPGWILAAMNDPANRRGIWYRKKDDILEVCGGREGDDYHVKLRVGEVIDTKAISDLMDILVTGTWVCEQAGIATEPDEEG
jgi:hypothetical protein